MTPVSEMANEPSPKLLVMPNRAKLKGKKVAFDAVNPPPGGLAAINDHLGRRVGYATPSAYSSNMGSRISATPAITPGRNIEEMKVNGDVDDSFEYGSISYRANQIVPVPDSRVNKQDFEDHLPGRNN